MRQGFTLIELSVVLVIIGLLTGGVLFGRSLIRAASLRTITTDHQRFLTARDAFRDKYQQLPGDFGDATGFWGRQSAQSWCATSSGAAVNANGVCDGNGDGRIGWSGAGQAGEMFQFWRHLALAGMIEGDFSGLAGSRGATDHDFGVNSPKSRLDGVTGWGASYLDNSSGSDGPFAVNYVGSLTIGRDDDIWADDPAIQAAEAWSIDNKLDDGKPGRGAVQAWPPGVNCNSARSNTDFDADYLLDNTAPVACGLIFLPDLPAPPS